MLCFKPEIMTRNSSGGNRVSEGMDRAKRWSAENATQGLLLCLSETVSGKNSFECISVKLYTQHRRQRAISHTLDFVTELFQGLDIP